MVFAWTASNSKVERRGARGKSVPPTQLDALADQSPLAIQLKVGFEKLANEARVAFPRQSHGVQEITRAYSA